MDKGNLHQSHTESIQKIKRQMALQILYLLTNIAHNPHQKKVVHIKEKKGQKFKPVCFLIGCIFPLVI